MSSKSIKTNKPWCVYITVYKGDKMPPFYIGYTSIKKFETNYYGSVRSKKYGKVFKTEIEENPHLFRKKISKTFVTKKDAMEYEEYLQTHFQVHRSSLFINMSISGKKFCNSGPHSEEARAKIGASNKGRTVSEETRAKMKLAKKNISEETRAKLSYSAKRRVFSLETRRKISISNKGNRISEEQKLLTSLRQKGKKRGPYKKSSILISF